MRMLQSIQSFVNNYFVVVDHEETATHELQRQVEASYSKKVLLQKENNFYDVRLSDNNPAYLLCATISFDDDIDKVYVRLTESECLVVFGQAPRNNRLYKCCRIVSTSIQ